MLECAAVCVAWNSAFVELQRLQPILSSTPFLLMSNIGVFKDERGEYQRHVLSSKPSCILFNPQSAKLHQILLPQLGGRWFCSSSFGWLLLIGFSGLENICLFNPFSRDRVILPPPGEEFTRRQYLKVVASSYPSDPNCIFLAIHSYGCQLAFCRPRDVAWTEISNFNSFCHDTIFYKDAFYVVDVKRQIFRISFGDDAVAEVLPIPTADYFSRCTYLVELDGDLLLVSRRAFSSELCPPPDYHSHQTNAFYVYRLDGRRNMWIKVESIRDFAILLGKHTSTSVAVSQNGFFRTNSVYFLDDAFGTVLSKLPSHDTGVMDLETRNIQWLYLSSPIWSCPLSWLRIGAIG